MAVLVEHSTDGEIYQILPGRWGSDVQATHRREGETGHNAMLRGNMKRHAEAIIHINETSTYYIWAVKLCVKWGNLLDF